MADPQTGEVIAFTSRYSRDIALMAVKEMGGAKGLVDWAKSSKGREDDFWVKIFPKTITKEVVLDDRRNVVDLLAELDIEDARQKVIPNLSPAPIDAQFTDFAPVKLGVDDEDDED